MKDADCVTFLQWALPRLHMRWPGFRKVRKQVCKRIDRRLHELALPDAEAYRSYLETHLGEWAVLDRCCRISISRFYRDRGVFDHLRNSILPLLATIARASSDRVLRCWSAGCASGEEAYTLNIVWRLCIRPKFPDVTMHLVATDSDSGMLDRARSGSYSASSLHDLPREWLTIAFIPLANLFLVKPEFRHGIEWRLQDIREELPSEDFHLILCRHLAFTYFDEALQRQTLDRLVGKLTPGGILVTGKQELLPHQPAQLEPCGNQMGIYRNKHEIRRPP